VNHVMVNAYWKSLKFQIPGLKGKRWRKIIDTSVAAPEDFCEVGKGKIIDRKKINVMDRSIIVLKAQ